MNYDDLLDNLYMENKGIDFGLRCYKNYNNKYSKKKNNKSKKKQQIRRNHDENKKEDKNDELMKKYVNNQFTFKQNYGNNFENNLEKDDINVNHQKMIELVNNKYEFEDIRLNYVMEKLGLETLIPVFEQYHMSFNDILFLTKDDLNELGLKIFQKNRLISFVEEYSSKAKNYTLEEIQKFFDENRIYDLNNYQQ